MQIHNLTPDIETVYHDPDFNILLESHLTYFRSNNIKIVQVSEHQNYKFEGDFYGVLDDLNIPKKYHFFITRINGFSSSNDFKGNMQYIIIPDINEIEMLKNIFKSKKI